MRRTGALSNVVKRLQRAADALPCPTCGHARVRDRDRFAERLEFTDEELLELDQTMTLIGSRPCRTCGHLEMVDLSSVPDEVLNRLCAIYRRAGERAGCTGPLHEFLMAVA